MSQHVAFCSANDRPVLVLLRADRDPAAGDPHELLCLDYGTRCTGAFCPMMCTADDEGDEAAAFSAGAGPTPLPGAA